MKKTIFICIVLLTMLVSMANGQTPVTDSLSPTSGPVGTVITISGSGFAPAGNIIVFECLMTDGIWLVQISADSPNGRTLQFKVPEYINPGCYYLTPPCASPSIKTILGSYAVTLKDAKTSKALIFDVKSSPTPTPTIGPVFDCIIAGDVDGNGKVDIIDALLIAKYSSGIPVIQIYPYCGDVNHDGTVNIIDALLVAQQSIGI